MEAPASAHTGRGGGGQEGDGRGGGATTGIGERAAGKQAAQVVGPAVLLRMAMAAHELRVRCCGICCFLTALRAARPFAMPLKLQPPRGYGMNTAGPGLVSHTP